MDGIRGTKVPSLNRLRQTGEYSNHREINLMGMF